MTDAVDETQFKSWIADAIDRAWPINRATAEDLAQQAYDNALDDVGQPFGHADYAWDRGAADTVATDYVLRFGEC